MIQTITFIQESIFEKIEGQNIEFKEINSKSPVNTIKNHAEKYVTGFLNASEQGDIYLGINDYGKVLGVTLNRREKSDRFYFLRELAVKQN
ncbi:MAG: ATP-binding protein [Trichormus sp. ATA11-4-KO1]|jgi:predicted HTH transcriptional regulator|nr:ATP-binding protein [Trichormus sp. ATA11-4-KO1]